MSLSFKKRYSPDILRFGEAERRTIQNSEFKIQNSKLEYTVFCLR